MIHWQAILMFLMAAALMVIAGKWFYGWARKEKGEIVERRKAAGELALVLSKLGLKRIPAFLIDYSTANYIVMYEKIHDMAKLALEDENAVLKEFEQVFTNVLNVKLQNPEARAYIAARLAEAGRPADQSVDAATLKKPLA